MTISTPNKLNITLDSQEEEAIKNYMNVLTSIQNEMTKFQCGFLADSFGQIITQGEINDILTNCGILLDVIEMYEE